MSTDGSEEKPVPAMAPKRPIWEFIDVHIEHLKLMKPISVVMGVATVDVSEAVVIRLVGKLDPGDMQWYDSYMPTLRIGMATSSRMETTSDGVQFTIYPEIDGEFTKGEVEFRARTSSEFSATGLAI